MTQASTRFPRDFKGRTAQDDLIYYFFNLPQRADTIHLFFDRWQKLAGQPLGSLRAKQVCLVLHRTAQAYDQFGRRLFGDGFRQKLQKAMHSWQGHAHNAMPNFTARDLDSVLWSLASIGIQPNARLMENWSRVAATELHNADHIEMTNTLWSHAALALSPTKPVIDAWGRAFNKNLPNLSARHTATTMWALAVLDSIAPNPTYAHYARACFNHFKGMNIRTTTPENSKDLAQMRDATLWFGFENNFPLPYQRGNTSSSLERDLHCIFKDAAMHEMGRETTRISRLDKQTDFALKTDTGVVHVEADGWTHLIRGADGQMCYNGQTLFQTALMRKVCPNRVLVRIPCTVLHEAEAQDGRIAPGKLRALLEAASSYARPRLGTPETSGAFMLAFAGGEMRLQHLRA